MALATLWRALRRYAAPRSPRTQRPERPFTPALTPVDASRAQVTIEFGRSTAMVVADEGGSGRAGVGAQLGAPRAPLERPQRRVRRAHFEFDSRAAGFGGVPDQSHAPACVGWPVWPLGCLLAVRDRPGGGPRASRGLWEHPRTCLWSPVIVRSCASRPRVDAHLPENNGVFRVAYLRFASMCAEMLASVCSVELADPTV